MTQKCSDKNDDEQVHNLIMGDTKHFILFASFSM